ncbi:MAG TPA: CoA transferase [Pseudorhodoplanes sp.]|nr:CoA transferase [Pseudorhodoplanes sp.]
MTEHSPYPLAGITVVDLSQIYNGPYATFLLAQAGAEVIKVEPKGGEHLRRRGVVGGAALPFAMLNGNKRSVSLDLKTPRGRALLIDMIKRADVLVENFAPGVMDRLGLGVAAMHAVNPRLVYASSSGYGQSGPYRDYPAMDLTVQAMSGVMSITGFADRPPVKAGPALCDFFAGVHLYGGIVTALLDRERTGRGRSVEVAMLDAVYASLSSNLGLCYGLGWKEPPRTGNRHGGLAESPYNVYPTRDGYIAIICVGELHWKNLIGAMRRPDLADDPRFESLKTRVAHMDVVDEIVGEFTKQFDREALFKLLLEHRVPCAPVRTLDEVVNDPHLHQRGMLQWIDHPQLGRIVVQSSPMRYDGAPPMPHLPSAPLGANNEDVLGKWLGLSAEEIKTLAAEGVI